MLKVLVSLYLFLMYSCLLIELFLGLLRVAIKLITSFSEEGGEENIYMSDILEASAE